METIVKLQDIGVKFGGLVALQGINLEIKKGEILALIGPNGAGKTTLFNLLTGIYTPTTGQILHRGSEINALPPYKRVGLGIARTFQNPRLIREMTVLENTLIAHPGCNKESLMTAIFGMAAQRARRKEIAGDCMKMLEIVGLSHKTEELAGNLPYVDQRLLEIARALVTGCEVLLLDEPAAGMNQAEKNVLTTLMAKLCREMDINIVIIEHDIGLIVDIADRIAVLDHGVKIAEGTGTEIKQNPLVIAAYLGDDEEEVSAS